MMPFIVNDRISINATLDTPAPAEAASPPAGERVITLEPKILNLALQGGGAHGAFTWGVLDSLLEDPEVAFEGISGSSAGAMNAVVLADGWIKGGAQGAREALAAFWTEIGKQMPRGMTQGQGDAISLSPASKMLANWASMFAPSQLNPMGLDPLRDLLVKQVDFEAIRRESPFKLFVAATQVKTGKLRIFREHELSVDMLLASACLPKIHHPVEIDGELYWDGGYAANPAIFPLFYDCASADILLVLLNPLSHDDTPRTVEEIQERIAEFSFSANFLREMQTFARAAEFSGDSVAAPGSLGQKLQDVRFHMVDISGVQSLQRQDTKMLAHGPFLEKLHAEGRQQASLWLAEYIDKVGVVSTVDVKQWAA